jgi:uncharacterized membrane protein
MPEFLNTPQIEVDSEDVSKNRVFGILSYIGILWLVGLIAASDSKYAKFHANQGLVLFLGEIALNVVMTILTVIFSKLHLGFLFAGLQSLVNLVPIAYMVFGIVFAAKGQARELPFIGKFHLLDK